jgi:hypothetical protein
LDFNLVKMLMVHLILFFQAVRSPSRAKSVTGGLLEATSANATPKCTKRAREAMQQTAMPVKTITLDQAVAAHLYLIRSSHRRLSFTARMAASRSERSRRAAAVVSTMSRLKPSTAQAMPPIKITIRRAITTFITTPI